MKTPLRFLKKAALAAALPALVSTAAAATSSVQPRLTWFNEDVSDYSALPAWAADCTLDTENGFIEIDGDVTYTPTASTENEVAYVDLTLKFASIPADLPDLPDNNAQTAITAADDSGTAKYYVYGKADASSAAAWLPVDPQDAAPVADATVTVTITVDYTAGTATYIIGGVNAKTVTLAATLGDNQKHVSTLTFSGDGCLGDFFGTQGVATHTLGGANVSYASNAAALAAAIAADHGVLETWVTNTVSGGWTTVAAGAGTAASPYLVPDLDTLKDVATVVQSTNCAGVVFQQTDDIALDAAWPGIGVQNGKDLINGSTADIPAFEAGAFAGVYDGGNFTVSNFQMAGGNLDYCGFFNSVNGGTIQNLKISYKEGKFAADTTASTTESGATFVGVARSATLSNLITLASPTASVSAGKGIGGIVGYVANGSTIDSCTNNVNLASYSNKAGGIAMIRQTAGTSTISNCKNTGTISTSATGDKGLQYGGIVGYVDHALVISNCENTAECKVLHTNEGTITMQGENKGNATVASYTYKSGYPVDGLNFATVDNGVATFVADNALALNGSYKVMATGATATFAFAEPGTIAFDTALFTPTYAVTAANGLLLTDATSGTTKTFTAAARPVRAVFLR